MYTREYDNQSLTFDFAMGLLNDNLLFVDRETQSIWSQLEAKAIDGQMKGKALQNIPVLQTTWKKWQTKHPTTKVWFVADEKGRPYTYRNRQPGRAKPKKAEKGHDTSLLGLGLVVAGKAVFFHFTELEKIEGPLKYSFNHTEVMIYYDKDGLTAWGENSEGELLPGVLAYDFGWLSFYPKSELFTID